MQQISLFNFDEAPDTAQPAKEKLKPKQEPQTEISEEIIDEKVREIEFAEEQVELLPVIESKNIPLLPVKRTGRGRKSMKELAATAHHTQVPADDLLFQKQYYSISAVAEMFCENISLIRFWENEFDILKPKKNGKGDRLFRPEDVKNLQVIYSLLREQKYTIEGAQDYMKRNKKKEETFLIMNELTKLKSFLLELKSTL